MAELYDSGQRQAFAADPQVAALVKAARLRFGDAIDAIVLYGSFTRGQKDTLLDLYVLLRDLHSLPRWQRWMARALPPNVYHLTTPEARAKVAVLTFDALERGVRGDVAPYFWARFAQPSALVYCADAACELRFSNLVRAAAERLVAAASSGVTAGLASAAFWEQTFALTYSAELRPEQSSRYAALYQANADYFDQVHASLAHRPQPPQTSWRVRRLAGKTLSFLRVVKSAFTFDDPVDYVLWKIERHSGVKLTPTDRQRRYPLIFGWGLVWQLYRRGAFK